MIQIKRLNNTTVLTIQDVPTGSLVHRELMGDHYVSLPFSLDEPVYFHLGDYAVIPPYGRFELTEPYSPKYNRDTAGYDYTLQLDAYYMKWKNKTVRYMPTANASETSFKLTATIGIHLNVIVNGINALGGKDASFKYDGTTSFRWELMNFPEDKESSAKFKEYNNTDFISALNDLAQIFDCEWWVEENTIYFGKCNIDADAEELEIDVNIESMSGSESSATYATRIIAFGSDRNLPKNYRANQGADITQNGVVQKRLMLPLSGSHACPYGYLQDANIANETEAIEIVVIDDNVFPRTKCVVDSVETYEDTYEDKETGETVTQTFYRVYDKSGLEFSSEYILEGQTLHIKFQSGSLNGMDFECHYDDEEGYYEIVANEDYGRLLPDTSLCPEEDDEFILIGWDSTRIENLGLIADAEEELYQVIAEKLQSIKKDPNTYQCVMMSDWYSDKMYDENFSHYSLGQPVTMVNPTFFSGSRDSRIIGYEIKLDIPYDTPMYIVGEASAYSRTRAMEEKIDSITVNGITYQGNANGNGSGVYLITTNDKTAPTDSNVYSAKKSEKSFARKDVDDKISSLWTFNNGHGARRGIQTHEYGSSGANEDNILGHGFELVEKTDSNGNRKSRLEVDELFVRIKAFFSSLEIREISYLGGNYAFSSAGSKIYHVEWLNGLGEVLPKIAANISSIAKFRCYLYSDDGTTATTNKWAANDQIMCQTFNLDEDVYENKSNKYYWRRCIGIGKSAITGDDSETEYQYVDISMSDCATGSDYPEDEDTIVQFGNWTNSARQGLIYLKVEGADAPAIIEYSGVGANGNHFVLPSPSLQLSPNRNIIYGEFHSIVNGSDDKVGDGETIDDQLRALIDALNDIKNQADQRFDIWFGSGAPLPNEDEPDEDANYPASEWTTNALKALHAQDLFYDTQREPASDGGRAWRWTAYEGEDEEVHYQWMEVTDADTVASLEKISDVASDGKLTGGAEKTRVAIEWQKAVDDYWEYKERAEDYEITTEWTAYHNSFVALGKLLNGGTTLTKNQGGTWNIPSWLSDLLSTTTITNADDYREAWNDYYASLTALLQAITAKAKELADAAQETADNAQETADNAVKSLEAIASDNKIDKTEIADIKHEFIAMLHEFWDEGGLKDQACDEKGEFISYDVSEACQDTEDAMKAIGKFLNGGTNWTYVTIWDEDTDANTVEYYLDWEQTLANLPLYLKSTYEYTEPITIDGDAFVTLWGTYYKCRASILGILADEAHKAANEADQKAQEAQDEIDTITADGILSSVEKKQVRKEWEEVVRSYTRNSALATIFDVSSSDYGTDSQGRDIVAQYTLAYEKLGNYLNGCSNPESTSAWTWTIGNIPKWLAYETETGYVNGQGMGGDTEIVPATYRSYWVNYYDLENAVLNAISEIAKHAGDEALTKFEEIADDGVVTPTEKNTILIQWLEIAKEFPLLVAQADVFISDASGATMVTALTNAKNTYVTRFSTLANYLNNGNYTYTLNPVNIPLPLWIDASHKGNSEELSTSQKAAFKDVWENYFSSRTSLQEVFAEASKEPGKGALGELDNLEDDDILTPFEKLTVLREWDAITVEKSDLLSKAASAHVSTSDYVLKYNVLGNYLNDPVASDQRDITTPFSGTPAALLTDGNTTIRGTQFKDNWSNFYNERTKLLSAISTSKVSYFVSVNVPTPPYHVGDIWMRLANSSDTQGKMYVCVVDNETSTGRLSDWADMSEITRDPFVLLAKVASKVYDLNGGYIQSRGSVDFVVARTSTSTTGQNGDVLYNASNNEVYTYVNNGWVKIINSTFNSLGSTLYSIIGVHTYKIYNTESTSASKYDMCVRNISFTDPFSQNTIDGNLNILVYSDGNWLTMQDSAKSMIENFADQLNSYMFASENGFIKASGLVTKTNISELFAQANDPDSGEIITKSYLQVYTSDFVNENGVREIISGVDISADKINLTGSDRISMLVKNSVKNIVNANLITNSLIGETSTVYGFANRSVRLTSGTTYTLSANGIVPSGAHANNMVLKIFIWRMADAIDVEENPERIEGQTWMNSESLTIEYNNGASQTKYVNLTADRTCEYHIEAYMYYTLGTDSTTNAGGTRTVGVTLNWMKLEKGQTATEWIAGVGDEILWKNYIGNPRAVDGTFDTYTSGSQTLSHCSKVTDPSFGEVVAITHDSNSSWQLRFTAISEYTNLTGKAATFFVICKNMGSNDDGSQLRFGGGEENVSALDTRTADFIDLGDGWRKYYATKYIATGLMNSNSGTNTGNIGINCVIGTWRVYAVGVVLGGVCPTTQDIMNQSGLIATGIDIQKRIIELRADKVRFTSSDGTISNKIWIDPTTGALNATDGNFSGKFRSYNPTTWNEINIDAYSGALVMKGPSAVQDGNIDLPDDGATQTELFRLEFQTDPDTLRRVANMRLNGIYTHASIDGIDGFYFGEGYGEGKRYFAMDLFGIRYIDEKGNYYTMSWEDLLRKVN